MSDLEQRVRGYMAACTAGDADLIASFFTPHAVHYFPPGMYGGPWAGARQIAERWAEAVRERGSSWTVDAIVVDEPRRQAVCEWTHVKAGADVLRPAEAPHHTARVVLRGAEWYEFDESGLITEIRAYYASPQAEGLDRLELGGFDYAGRGYPMPG
jgi:methyltransferase